MYTIEIRNARTINICYVIHTPSGLGLGLVMSGLINIPG